MHREFLSILPFRYSLNCKSGRDEGLPGENRPSLDPDLFSPKDVRQRPPLSSLFAETRDYLCPTDSVATRPIPVGSVPTPEMRLAARQIRR